jgi:hypothetical protein
MYVSADMMQHRALLIGSMIIALYIYLGGVLDEKKVGRALSRTGEIFSGVEKRISGFHEPERNQNSTFLHPRRGSPAKTPLNAPKNTSFWVFSNASPIFQNARTPKML